VNSAIVFVVDRLGAGFLGPYGNAWLPTPHCNRLAARALVAETVLADSPDLNQACRAFWTGRRALEPAADLETSLAARAARCGAKTLLVADDESVAQHPLAAQFGEHVVVRTANASRSAARIEDTDLFHLVAAAIEAISQSSDPQLAWIHARGMAGPWDAPRALREQVADAEDPAPPNVIEPPERFLMQPVDPDEVLGLVQAYAGQVQLVDECLEMLLDSLDAQPNAEETLFALTSPRGYPLGEHGRVGVCDNALYSELLQVPLIVQLPRGEGRLMRTQRLIQTSDLFATLVEACGWGELTAAERAASLLRVAREESTSAREVVVAFAAGQRAIRTPAWLMRETREPSHPQPLSHTGRGEKSYELFAKPDDRWEANEVSSRCGDVAELLAAQLDRIEQAARAGQLAELAPLPEILLDCWR
jgi:arylsulfatase A-like enzyme